MTSLILFAALAQEPTSMKIVPPEGGIVFAERRTGQVALALHLSFAAPEPEGQAGWRHMVEHLAARGQKRDVDRKLETKGCFLTAETTRYGMLFLASGPPGSLDTCVAAFRSICSGLEVSAEDIQKEAGIMRQELATVPMAIRAARLHGEVLGPDPEGDPATLAKADPQGLSLVYASIFDRGRASLVALSDEPAPSAAAKLATVLDTLSRDTKGTGLWPEPKFQRTPQGFLVGTLTARRTLSALAWSFGVREMWPGSEVVYTPSPWPGVVTLIDQSPPEASASDKARTWAVGVMVLHQWIAETAASARGSAAIRARMMLAEPGFDLVSLQNTAKTLGPDDLKSLEGQQ